MRASRSYEICIHTNVITNAKYVSIFCSLFAVKLSLQLIFDLFFIFLKKLFD